MQTLAVICAIVVAIIALLGMLGFFDAPHPKKSGVCLNCGKPINIFSTYPHYLCGECFAKDNEECVG